MGSETNCIMITKPVIICLTPVRNEAWILDTFLQCTSLWADYIIIADQQSTDGSREIALKYPKVILIDNPVSEYNEVQRQKLLLTEARKINGKRLLIALDADEFFTSDYAKTSDWEKMIISKEGNIFAFQWINIYPKFKKCWEPKGHFPWAYMDDGGEHKGLEMHNPRIPVENSNRIIKLSQIKVLHFQYLNWARMESKHRYYQCLERIKYPNKNPIDIFRMYHHMYDISKEKIKIIENAWFENYENKNILLRNFTLENKFWYDIEINKLLQQYGSGVFRKEVIWDVSWNVKDPRNLKERLVQFWLTNTKTFQHSKIIKSMDKLLKKIY